MNAFKFSLYAATALVALLLLFLLGQGLGIVGSVASAPARVITKTLETDNILQNYEWFFDVNAQYTTRVGQIKGHSTLAVAEPDTKERARLQIELTAMRQSCRELAAKYNANSAKVNRALFKSRGLPESIALSTCEA